MGIGNRRGRLRRRWRISRYGESGRVIRRSVYAYLFYSAIGTGLWIFLIWITDNIFALAAWYFTAAFTVALTIEAIRAARAAWDRHHRAVDDVDERAAEIISWFGRPDSDDNPHVYHNYIKLVHDNDHDGGVYNYEQRGDFRDN
jgi:hypothetical protein